MLNYDRGRIKSDVVGLAFYNLTIYREDEDYKISQTVCRWYDTYDSAIVCAENEYDASCIYPIDYKVVEVVDWEFKNTYWDWCTKISDVNVEYLGEAKEWLEKWVICASFNAW